MTDRRDRQENGEPRFEARLSNGDVMANLTLTALERLNAEGRSLSAVTWRRVGEQTWTSIHRFPEALHRPQPPDRARPIRPQLGWQSRGAKGVHRFTVEARHQAAGLCLASVLVVLPPIGLAALAMIWIRCREVEEVRQAARPLLDWVVTVVAVELVLGGKWLCVLVFGLSGWLELAAVWTTVAAACLYLPQPPLAAVAALDGRLPRFFLVLREASRWRRINRWIENAST